MASDDDQVIKIRVYDKKIDKIRVEDLERRCKVGPAETAFLFMDTMGDPMCRIRNSPMYKMLVAEFNNELVAVIQGTIKIATFCSNLIKDQAIVGYILGLRVLPLHRRTGIGSNLVQKLEEWFVANHVDFAYMATEKDNEASVRLFTNKLGFIKFRTPAILVNPVSHHSKSISPNVRIVKLKIEQAEFLYRKFMGSTDFFPCDIDKVLKNKLSLGTWIAYRGDESWNEFGSNNFVPPNSWAMLSVWNSCDVFKLKVGKPPISWIMYGKSSRFIDRVFPCLKIRAIPDVFKRFGFYFMYGLHCEGPGTGSLVHSLCRFVHNMARKCKDCKVIVTEVGGCDESLREHIPHWRLLSCPEDLWCIKGLRSDEKKHLLFESIRTTHPPPRAIFVDPREV